MTIQINKDFLTEYKDDVWKGFNTREVLSIISGGAVSISVVALLFFLTKISPATLVYVAIPLAFPMILYGFWKYQGYLTVSEFLTEVIFSYYTKELHFESEEDTPLDMVYSSESSCGMLDTKKTRRKKDAIHY